MGDCKVVGDQKMCHTQIDSLLTVVYANAHPTVKGRILGHGAPGQYALGPEVKAFDGGFEGIGASFVSGALVDPSTTIEDVHTCKEKNGRIGHKLDKSISRAGIAAAICKDNSSTFLLCMLLLWLSTDHQIPHQHDKAHILVLLQIFLAYII